MIPFQAILDKHFSGKHDPIWFGNPLTVEDQTFRRGKPRPYLLSAIELFKKMGGKIIVEIGSMRQPMNHTVHEFNPYCCNDGHSTAFWAVIAGPEKLYSVDINPANVEIVRNTFKMFSHVHPLCQDGIQFLASFRETIDLLYLDAWDGDPGTPFAERHLEAFNAAQPVLAQKSILLIDDTDVWYGGKGRLVIPAAIRAGYDLILIGRQTLMVRGFDLSKE